MVLGQSLSPFHMSFLDLLATKNNYHFARLPEFGINNNKTRVISGYTSQSIILFYYFFILKNIVLIVIRKFSTISLFYLTIAFSHEAQIFLNVLYLKVTTK